MKTLAIDGNNLLVRSMKASERGMRLSVELDGEEVNTGPIMLFINLVSKYVRQEQPDRVVVCWDGGHSTYRLGIYADYKAARPDRDPEEKDHTPFALAKEFLSLSGLHHVEQAGVEADDLIAAYWHQRERGDEFVIVSGDKDFLQLIGRGVSQLRPGTGDDERWTTQRVLEKMDCFPQHIPAVMALTGDSGDGVPGVPGFGTKTACKFLSKYDWDLEALLDAGEAKVAGHEEEARRNLALVDLRTPIPGIEVQPLPPFSPTGPASLLYPDLRDWLTRYSMNSVLDRLSTNSLWR